MKIKVHGKPYIQKRSEFRKIFENKEKKNIDDELEEIQYATTDKGDNLSIECAALFGF